MEPHATAWPWHGERGQPDANDADRQRPPIRTASSARAYVASIAYPNANASHRAPSALVPPSPWIAEHAAYLRRNNKDEDKNATSPTSLPAVDLVTPVSRAGSPTSCTSAKTAHPHTPTGGGGQPKCHYGSSRCRADTETDTYPAAPTDEDELAALRVENYKLSLDVDNANRLNSALTLTNRTLLEDLARLDNELTVSKLHRVQATPRTTGGAS